MKSILYLLIFGLILKAGRSQTISTQPNRVEEKYAVTLMPAFFPMVKIAVQPGFQFRISNHLALMTESAFRVPGSESQYGSYDKTQFFKISSELKFFPEKSPAGRFGSIQLGYVRRNFINVDSGWYHSKDDTVMTGYSRLNIKSPVFFGTVKMGGEIIQWRKVFMDIFVGLGIRIIPTKYNAQGRYIQGPWTPRKDFVLFEPTPAWEYDKTSIRPHFSLGFRIGRKFK